MPTIFNVLVDKASRTLAFRDEERHQVDAPFKELTLAKTIVTAKGRDKRSIRSRTLLSQWPIERDSPHKPLVKYGKNTPDLTVALWGETLMDFYHFMHPKIPNYDQITTSSKCGDWARKVNKTDLAYSNIFWADAEDIPRRIEPVDVTHLVETNYGSAMFHGRGVSLVEGERTSVEQLKNLENVPKPFDHSNYPRPFPLIPFSQKVPPLQKRIPFHLLPKKLHIHDPDNVLPMSKEDDSDTENINADSDEHEEELQKRRRKWPLGNAGISHTYNLQLSSAAQLKSKSRRKGKSKARMEGLFLHPDTSSSMPTPPPIFVEFPPRPSPQPVEEAHLYLDRREMLGHGNHSSVCLAELELPLPMLQEPEICYECILLEDQDTPLDECSEVTVGKEYQFVWDPTKPAAMTHCEIEAVPSSFSSSSSLSPSSPHSSEPTGKVQCFTFMENQRKVFLNDPDGNDPRNCNPGEDKKSKQYSKRVAKAHIGIAYTPTRNSRAIYTGPLRIVSVPSSSQVSWHIPGVSLPCQHQLRAAPVDIPKHFIPTIKVSVAAKLSNPNDSHLDIEAKNYQAFPDHFFEHWTGYFVTPPLHDPVPCGAIVPQFYGYYAPSSSSLKRKKSYLSPILLLENCGKQVKPSEMSMDDRQECASLVFRLHSTGWTQGSVAERNFVVQEGPLDAWPIQREYGMHIGGIFSGEIPVPSPDAPKVPTSSKSFRVIDFGRAVDCKIDGSYLSRAGEEATARSLFQTQTDFQFVPSL